MSLTLPLFAIVCVNFPSFLLFGGCIKLGLLLSQIIFLCMQMTFVHQCHVVKQVVDDSEEFEGKGLLRIKCIQMYLFLLARVSRPPRLQVVPVGVPDVEVWKVCFGWTMRTVCVFLQRCPFWCCVHVVL